MERELGSFPLPPVHKLKLNSAGFTKAQEVLELSPSSLSEELNISNEDALSILKVIRGETAKGNEVCASGKSVLDILKTENAHQPITTFSQSLDDLLGGGVPLGKITEICGAPGVGKTQLCIQLCVDVQMPECFGGLDSEAVFVDTEGSFIIDRVVDVAKAAVEHCRWITKAEALPEQTERVKSLTFEHFLGGLHYIRCLDNTELLALGHVLPDFLQQHPKVKLVVIDSIAFHFRHGFDDWSLRTRLLNGLAQQFIQMATHHNLAVVLTNQMTTKFVNGEAKLVPALGESWGHASTIRVIFHWNGNQRQALLYKSPSQKETVVPYQITVGGIRDVAKQNQNRTDLKSGVSLASKTGVSSDNADHPPQKKQRLQ